MISQTGKIWKINCAKRKKCRRSVSLPGGVAHDFNNQLASILGYSEMLRNRLDDSRLLRFAENIRTAAGRSADLVQKLLDFSRKGKQTSVPVVINALLSEVISVLERSIDKRIQVRQVLNAGPVKVMGDPTQLQNALLNLAINARDAMPEGGEMVFETDIIALGEEFRRRHNYKIIPGTYLKMSISDSGCGMDKETQKHIFEPFFTTKAVGKGTGMGLASVYGTVLGHKGHINVYSEVGKGTAFHIYLPMPEELQDLLHEPSSLVPVKGTGHILVVDDEDLVRQMTVESLEDLGYQVTECRNGQEALELYRKAWEGIDLILLDQVMPTMNGQETYQELCRINPEVGVILCSGYSTSGNVQSFLELGIQAFVGKPFSALDLSQKIAEVLGRVQKINPA